jgi:serine/threonine protein kinase
VRGEAATPDDKTRLAQEGYGCNLFEMFTAQRLFPALTESDWERAHLGSVPVDLTRFVPELTGEIDRFVRRCLAKGPAVRPQSWDEIVAFFAEWYHRLTGKAVVMEFSSLALDSGEWLNASSSLSTRQHPFRSDGRLLAN